MKPIRVLIVEDSPVVAEHLRRIISADHRLEVAGVASSGEESLVMVERLSPDVISMDVQLPGIEGLEATRRIMARQPTPIVIVSSSRREEVPLSMQALQAGALSVVEKPVSATHESYAAMAGKLCTQLAIMSDVKVLRQREKSIPAAEAGRVKPAVSTYRGPYRLLGIAASTGGPIALVQLFSRLGADFPLPIVVVQHMAPAFLPGFAEWLSSVMPLPVTIINGPTPLLPGNVYLPPQSDCHLAVRGAAGYPNMAYPDAGPMNGVHRPSANVLFSSMARTMGAASIGVVLTGMGDDGAEGLRELRGAGSWVIAEDESTAVVYGMPAAAVRAQGVHESLPLPAIAPRILEIIEGQRAAA